MEITAQLVKMFRSKLAQPVSYRDAKTALRIANGDFGIALDILDHDKIQRDTIDHLKSELDNAHNCTAGIGMFLAISVLFNACFIGYLAIF